MQKYLEAGKVVTTHGVRGEMKLELWCDGVAFLKKVGRLYTTPQGGRCYKITSIRPQGQMALLQLEGVSDMDAARALRGQVFYFDRDDATLPAGKWYVADLIGCEVRDADTGKVYGVVTSVDHPGAQDIYTVKAPSGKEYMFPGVDAFLKERNPPEGYLLVTPIPGLLDDDFDSEREEEQAMGMRVDIVTLFPEMCQQVLDSSIIGRAAKKGYIETHCHQIRDYTLNKQKQTDDYPYGGGCGMVLYAQPIADCLRAVQKEVQEQGRPAPHIVFLTAGGQRYTEEHARRLAQYDNLTLVCGHYEGIDERVIDAFADEEISIGDYILTGGELASLVVADSVLRLKPGVLAEQKGYEEESYWDGLLEYPQYTRPEVWEGRAVPPVLLEGNHQKIDAWRGQQSRERTRLRRPELYEQWCETHPLTEIPKWKRGENVRLVKTAEQMEAAAKLFAEGRRSICAGGWVQEALDALTPEMFLPQLQQEKQEGWVCYLHYTKDVPDATVSVHHKTGQVEHLFVTESARGRGIGQKMLDFARKKLPEHEHPVLTVLNTNTRALALYRRMGWQVVGAKEKFDPAKDPLVVRPSQVLEMRYQG